MIIYFLYKLIKFYINKDSFPQEVNDVGIFNYIIRLTLDASFAIQYLDLSSFQNFKIELFVELIKILIPIIYVSLTDQLIYAIIIYDLIIHNIIVTSTYFYKFYLNYQKQLLVNTVFYLIFGPIFVYLFINDAQNMILLYVNFRTLIMIMRFRYNFNQIKKIFQKDQKKALVFYGQSFTKCIYGGNKKNRPMLYIQNMGKEVKIFDLVSNSFTQIHIYQGKLLEFYKKHKILVIFQDHFVSNKIYLYQTSHKKLINEFSIKADQLVPNDQDMLVATKYSSSFLTNTMSIVNLQNGQIMYLCEMMCRIHLFIKFQEFYYLFFTENEQLYVWIFNKNFLSQFQKWFVNEQNQGESMDEQQSDNDEPNNQFQNEQDLQIDEANPQRNENERNQQINDIHNGISSFEQYQQYQQFNLPNNLKIDDENEVNQFDVQNFNQFLNKNEPKQPIANTISENNITDSNFDQALLSQKQTQVQSSFYQSENQGSVNFDKLVKNQKLHICSSNPNLQTEVVRISDNLVIINRGIYQIYFDLGCQKVVKKQSNFILDVKIKKIQNCEGGFFASNDTFNEFYNYEQKFYQNQGQLTFAVADDECTSLLYGERILRNYQLQENTCIFKKNFE
ncbi:hypothetical protein ABPG74_013221 [Tetrahymena malaccensis]